MDWTTIIGALIGVLGGGGITGLVVIPFTRKKAKAEAEKTAIDNYETYTSRIEARMEKLEQESEKSRAEAKAWYEAMMTAFGCRLLMNNPEANCPVIVAFHKSKDNDCD